MRVLWIAAVATLLTSCAYQPDEKPREAYKAMQQDTPVQGKKSTSSAVPDDVAAFLNQSVERQAGESRALVGSEPRFVLQADGVAAKQFFYSLTVDTPYNIVVHPDVSGDISLDLKDVTIDETLDVISDIYGYEIRRDGRMIQVYPAGVRTQTFTLDYLSLKRFGLSQTQITSGGVSQERNNNNTYGNNNSYNNSGSSNMGGLGGLNGGGQNQNFGNMNAGGANGASVNTQSETDLWGSLEDMIQGIVGGNGSVVLSPQAGLVSVTAQPSKLRAVGQFLDNLQSRLQRQVILEARIVEVTLGDQYQQGIRWNELNMSGRFDFGFNGSVPNDIAAATADGVFGLTFNSNRFTGFLELLQTQGSVQVLSNPRVTASNNQKAVIKIGEDEYYVTDVTSQTNTTVTQDALTSSNVDLTPFFSGISLDVTPQISDDGEVTLHVHPSVVETKEQEKVITIGDETLRLPLARSNIRESDTIVRARSGEIVVLGGLMQNSTSENVEKVPLLGDLPLVGNLFKNKSNDASKKELVILIKPTVIGADTWQKELERSRELLETWFPDIAHEQ